jgi:hypothetical protein
MNNEKIKCNKCDFKFFILNREVLTCTNCQNIIIINRKKEKINLEDEENQNILDHSTDSFDIEDDDQDSIFPKSI